MKTTHYDVIIIGGGFAGVTAARELRQSGKNVLVLEAKDRLGGRSWLTELAGIPIELGGGYVHWTHPHIWAEINRYNLEILERPYYARTNTMRKTRFLINGEMQNDFTPEQSEQIGKAFKEYVAPSKEVFPNPFNPFLTDGYKKYDHLSNEDRINELELNELQRATLLRTTSIQCNNEPSQGGYIEALRWYSLSNSHTDTYADSLSRFTLVKGTGHLLNCIIEDANAEIKLNSAVKKITQKNGIVNVETRSGNYSATNCIVATALNVWKNIEFSPAISKEKINFSTEELSGKGGKVYIQLKGKFKDNRWSSINTSILSVLPHYISDEMSIVVAFTHPKQRLEDFTKESLQKEINRWDDSYEVQDFKYHNWVTDPLFLGTWGNFRPNQFSKYFKNALTPEGNIYFAGSDLALGWRGFFDGAIESGISTARKILAKK